MHIGLNMRVLLLLDHAPDYRESFLRCLSERTELIVLAHSCEQDGLTSPEVRSGYVYHALSSFRPLGSRFTLNSELYSYIKEYKPDVVCIALNIRYPLRLLHFIMLARSPKVRWIWWGQIFGASGSKALLAVKQFVLKRSRGALVYSEDIASNVKALIPSLPTVSFNNSQFLVSEFRKLDFARVDGRLKILFVGRPQNRKRLDLLLSLALRRSDVDIRLVGPAMAEYFADTTVPTNVALYPAAHGSDLVDHFRWSDVVFNPGHLGLLVMNAACHHRPIAISSVCKHAPEVILARQANQLFVNFENDAAVDTLIDELISDRELLGRKAQELYDCALQNYSVDHMADKHVEFFNEVINTSYESSSSR